MKRIAALALAAAALGGAQLGRSARAAAQPTPTASPQTVTTPGVPATAAPSAAPTPIATPTVSAAPTMVATPAYNFVYRPAPAASPTPFPGPNPPEIDEIDVSDATIVAPSSVRVRVLTSAAVTSVTADTFGRTLSIPQERPGLFALAASVPDVPFFLKNRTYNIEFVAAVPDGRTARVTIPLTLR